MWARTVGSPPVGRNFNEAQAGEQAHKEQDFIVLHQFRAGAKGHILWHAVNAAQIAVIGQAYP
jgi:hypothetical protein